MKEKRDSGVEPSEEVHGAGVFTWRVKRSDFHQCYLESQERPDMVISLRGGKVTEPRLNRMKDDSQSPSWDQSVLYITEAV